MMCSQRNVFKRFSIDNRKVSHAGLWLDKFIETQDRADTEARRKLVEQVSQIAIPDSYVSFFKRWEKELEQYGVARCKATVLGRMVIGLGDESVLETSVTLHQTYGVPYIPGSALKGLAASYARHYLGDSWVKGREAYNIVFGDTESAGYITFFDALYIPGSVKNDKPLAPDVITVHHPDYYGDKGEPPADWDSPNPVPFLSATGDYLLALAGDAEWVNAVFSILTHALRDVGVGAKTSSGYGRMAVGEAEKPVATTAETMYQQQREAAEKEIQLYLNKHEMTTFVEMVGDEGCIVQPENKYLSLKGFISASTFQGVPQGNINCIVRGVIERDGEWFIDMEWAVKKEKKKGKK